MTRLLALIGLCGLIAAVGCSSDSSSGTGGSGGGAGGTGGTGGEDLGDGSQHELSHSRDILKTGSALMGSTPFFCASAGSKSDDPKRSNS